MGGSFEIIFTLLFVALGACTGEPKHAPCFELPASDALELARVGNAPILVDQVVSRLRKRGSNTLRRHADAKKLRAFVDDQVRFELLALAARDRGLQHDPDVIDAARKVMVRKLLQHDLSSGAFDHVNDDAVDRYYHRHSDEYVQPKKIRIDEIELAPTQEGRALAQGLIEQLRRQGDKKKGHFAHLARKHSRRKANKGPGISQLFKDKQEYITEFGQSFASVVFAGKTGDLVATPVQSIRGWHVVKVLAVREPLMRRVEHVREEIREKLMGGGRSRTFQKYLDEIRKRHPVAIYDGRIAELSRTLAAESSEP